MLTKLKLLRSLSESAPREPRAAKVKFQAFVDSQLNRYVNIFALNVLVNNEIRYLFMDSMELYRREVALAKRLKDQRELKQQRIAVQSRYGMVSYILTDILKI